MDRDRLRSDFGSSSSGPRIRRPNTLGQFHTSAHFTDAYQVETIYSQTVSLDTDLEAIITLRFAGPGLSPSSPTSVRLDPSHVPCL